MKPLEIEIMALNDRGHAIGPAMATADGELQRNTKRKATKFYIVPKGTTFDPATGPKYPKTATFSITEL